MTEEEALDRLDGIAGDLCRAYAEFGVVCFVIRNTDSSRVRLIGPRLPASSVVPLLHEAAKGYEQNDPLGGEHLN